EIVADADAQDGEQGPGSKTQCEGERRETQRPVLFRLGCGVLHTGSFRGLLRLNLTKHGGLAADALEVSPVGEVGGRCPEKHQETALLELRCMQRNGLEMKAAARCPLGQSVQAARGDCAQFRIAANGLPVVQQYDGLAICWHLDGSQAGAFCKKTVARHVDCRAAQVGAHAVGLWSQGVRVAEEGVQGLRTKSVYLGAGNNLQVKVGPVIRYPHIGYFPVRDEPQPGTTGYNV